MTRLKNKHVLVLGLGETGVSMLRWLKAQGAILSAADSRISPPGETEAGKYVPAGGISCGEFSEALLEGVDLVAISPGVPMRDSLAASAVARNIPVVGDIELFAQQLAENDCRKNTRVIAITGANGKTTVASMVAHMCRTAGRDAVAAGNISPAVLDAQMARGKNQPEVWVLELSSFQLETTETLNADAATVLNVSEDHMDRYTGIDEYAAAKARIFLGSGVQILNRDDTRCMQMALPGRTVVTFGMDVPRSKQDWGIERATDGIWLVQGDERLLEAGELPVAGLHNAANALAALALCRAIDLPMPELLAALRSFKGLPHRVQRVAEIGNVIYYDDSKGTNVGATIAALQGLGRKAVLIAGGEGKGQDFAPLRQIVAKHARAVVLIGCDAPLIESALAGCGVDVVRAKDMSDAVQQASQRAQSGEAVLLSPACASFDMFRNYTHRAEVFVKAVHELGVAFEPDKEGAWSR